MSDILQNAQQPQQIIPPEPDVPASPPPVPLPPDPVPHVPSMPQSIPPIPPPDPVKPVSEQPKQTPPMAPLPPTDVPEKENPFIGMVTETISTTKTATNPAPASVENSKKPTEAPKNPPVSSKPAKKRLPIGVLLTTLLVLAVTIPLSVFYVSQQKNIADTRGKAAEDQCTDQNGNPGETCSNLNRCDIAGGCNPACGNKDEVRDDEICDVPNGYCKSGYSCRKRATGYHLDCVSKQCVNVLCDPGVPTCADTCSSHADCGGGTTPTPTPSPPGGKKWNQCTSSTGPIPCGSCLIKSVGAGTMTFGCELNCGGSASNCPGGSAESYTIAHRWEKCKNKVGSSCTGSSSDYIESGNLGGPGPWSISGQSSFFNGSGTFTNPGCGRVQVDVQMSAQGTNVAGGIWNSDTDCAGTSPTPTPPSATATPVPPTPTDEPIAVCKDIKIYKGGKVVDPKTLEAGDEIVIAVVGEKATKARIKINNGEFTETKKKNKKGEFILSYTIPADVVKFSIQAEVFRNGKWK